MRLGWIAAAITLLAATACQSELPTRPYRGPLATTARSAYLVTGAASSESEFRDLCARRGLTLSETQLTAIAQATTVLPNGHWAGDLTSDWRQHGLSAQPAIDSPDDFLASALRFGRQRDARVGFYFDTEAFRSTGRITVAHWEPEQGQYLELRADGAIASYRPSQPLPDEAFVRVPVDMMPGAR